MSDTLPTTSLPTAPPPPRDLEPRCETCGYELASVLESAGPSGACPECGTPCWQSGPALRPGTPWQQRIGLTSFWLTIWYTIAKPAELFRVMEASSKRAFSLLLIQTFIAATAFLSPWSGVFVSDPVRQLRFARSFSRIFQIVGAVVAQISLLAIFLSIATLFLGWALRSYARARGWTVPRGTTLSIVAHASVGWTVLAGVVWSLLTAWFVATLIISSSGSASASRLLGQASGWLATSGGRYGLLPIPVVVLGAGGALVARIALTALHSCKFANAPESAPRFEPKHEETQSRENPA